MMMSIEKAERRGLLRQQDLSPVQSLALEIKMMVEERERNSSKFEQVKLAVLSSDPSLAEKLFPEFFPSRPAKSNEELDESLVSSDGPVMFEEMKGADLDEVISMLGLQGQMKIGDMSDGE